MNELRDDAMTKADQSHQAALEKIAQVRSAEGIELQLNSIEFHALDSLPHELATLTNLEKLYLNKTQVSSIVTISALKNLRVLSLEGAPVSDISPLQALGNLQFLYLDGTQVSDLTELRPLVSLRRLYLDGTLVDDLSPLQGLVNLKRLYLDGLKVSDLGPLQTLTSLDTLTFNHTLVSDITPLRSLESLETLVFNQTRVRDLGPLRGLKNLKRLALEGTPVEDLRPIAEPDRPISEVLPAGLFFRESLATRNDATLAELVQIEDKVNRTARTLDYLRNLPPWPEPYTLEGEKESNAAQLNPGLAEEPKQDPSLPLIWGERGFAFVASSIDTDPVTEAALDDLRLLLETLRRKGNRHDDLYRIATELLDRSAGVVADLNLVKLHISYQKLRRMHMGHPNRQDPFDDETISSMEAVFDVLPGVTLADDNVRVLIERQEAERNATASAKNAEASNKLLERVISPDAPFSSDVKDVATEILRPEFDDRLSGTSNILSRNVTVSVLKFVGVAIAAGSIGGPVGNFVYNNGPELLTYAAAMGDEAFFWAQSIIAKFRVEYEVFMGIAHEVAGKTHLAKESSAEQSDFSED